MSEVTRNSEKAQPVDSLTVIGRREKEGDYKLQNVLHNYRSYTYNFALAIPPKSEVSNPNNFPLNFDNYFLILKSGGKGTKTFDPNSASALEVLRAGDPLSANDPEAGSVYSVADSDLGKELVKGFNSSGAGRLDVFIDNFEMLSLVTYDPVTRTTRSSPMSFDIVEPYSAGGFIQALRAGAWSAGYKSQQDAVCVLRLSFYGYPDSNSITDPEEVPYATRYFAIRLTAITAELNENGMRYKCKAIPWNEGTYGRPNKLPAGIKIDKKTKVSDIINDLETQLNNQIKEISKKSKPKENADEVDEYRIRFADENGDYTDNTNQFAQATVENLFRGETVYKFKDPGKDSQGNSESNRLVPNTGVIQFAEGRNITDAIEAIIRDSSIGNKIVADLPQLLDEYGRINYFIIDVESEPLKYDSVNRRQLFRYIFVIRPFKIHYTRIKRYQGERIDASKFKTLISRTYNYFYTGKNIDIINFKLDYQYLFFESVPRSMGNAEIDFVAQSLAPGNRTKFIDKPTDTNNIIRSQAPTPSQGQEYDPQQAQRVGTAGPIDRSPIAVLVRSIHEGIINSKGSQQSAEIEIIGDPVFLITPSPGKLKYQTDNNEVFISNGEVNHYSGEFYININFRNPVDIGQEGFFEFDKNQSPFGGIYRVIQVRQIFKDGIFKQILKIIRMPGQIIPGEKIKPTDPADKTELQPQPRDSKVVDVTMATKPSRRFQGFNVLTNIQRLISTAAALPNQLAASLTAALTQPISEGQNFVNQQISDANAAISGVRNDINSAINGITKPVAEVGEKLGISPQNLAELSKASPLAVVALLGIAKSIPAGTNIRESINQGVNLNFPAFRLPNLPPSQPKSVAPTPEQNPTDLANLVNQGGQKALASAFGTLNVNSIPGGTIPDDLANDLLQQIKNSSLSNPLQSVNNVLSSADARISADRSLAQLQSLSNSVEVNLRVSGSQVESNLDTAVTTKLGSKIESPLVRLKQTNSI